MQGKAYVSICPRLGVSVNLASHFRKTYIFIGILIAPQNVLEPLIKFKNPISVKLNKKNNNLKCVKPTLLLNLARINVITFEILV